VGWIQALGQGGLLTGMLCLSLMFSRALAVDEPAFEEVPKSWVEACPAELGQSCAEFCARWPERTWWLKFGDPILVDYIQKAVSQNHDFKAAAARVLQARAVVRQAIAQQLPTVSIGPQAFRLGLPNFRRANNFDIKHISAFSVPLSVSYEADIWGKYWNQTQSARKALRSAEWDLRSAEIVLISEVATAYFNLIRNDAMATLQKNYLSNLKEILDLQRALYTSGLGNLEAVLEAERNYARAEIDLHAINENRAVFAHQLMILTGEPPKPLDTILRSTVDDIHLPDQFDVGLPIALIARRPDIQSQEALLRKADIDVRVARKNFLPTAKFNGLFGFITEDLDTLGSGSGFFSFIYGNINQPIFQGGKTWANLRLQQAKQKEQLEHYRQTILNAFKEVEDSLKKLRANYEKLGSNQREQAANVENYTLIQDLYQSGLNSRLNVTEAENLVIDSQNRQASIKMDIAISTVSLYKALGGGY
jgi:multidrug efflux system outer membrane protein